MLTKSKIALSLALAFGTASAAMAAPRHPVHQRFPASAYQSYGYVHRQLPPSAYQSYGYAVEHGRVQGIQGESGAALIQDRDEAQSNGYAPENYW